MVNLKKLRVSQTKNGYQKIARLIVAHPRNEILDNVYGVHPEINLVKSQVANILGAAPGSDSVPEYWDEIRQRGDAAVESLLMVAVIFSHYKFIDCLADASQNAPIGLVSRKRLGDKAFTNFVYALSRQRICPYSRGATNVVIDFTQLFKRLRSEGFLVRQILRDKLTRCGWIDPKSNSSSMDLPFIEQCISLRFHQVFGLTPDAFSTWLSRKRLNTH